MNVIARLGRLAVVFVTTLAVSGCCTHQRCEKVDYDPPRDGPVHPGPNEPVTPPAEDK